MYNINCYKCIEYYSCKKNKIKVKLVIVYILYCTGTLFYTKDNNYIEILKKKKVSDYLTACFPCKLLTYFINKLAEGLF